MNLFKNLNWCIGSIGVLVYWCIGVLAYYCYQLCWRIGVLAYWQYNNNIIGSPNKINKINRIIIFFSFHMVLIFLRYRLKHDEIQRFKVGIWNDWFFLLMLVPIKISHKFSTTLLWKHINSNQDNEKSRTLNLAQTFSQTNRTKPTNKWVIHSLPWPPLPQTSYFDY